KGKTVQVLKPILDKLEKEICIRRRDDLADENPPLKTPKRFKDNTSSTEQIIFQKWAVLDVVDNYLIKKVEAKRAELGLKNLMVKRGVKNVFDKLKPEQRAELLGRELFKLKTNNKPVGVVSAERIEGYVIVNVQEDEDYKKFKGSDSSSGGEFHRAVRCSAIGEVDLLIVKGSKLSQGSISVARHERQHFINHSMFSQSNSSIGPGKKIFGDLENPSPLTKKAYYPGSAHSALETYGISTTSERIDVSLRAIKDEVLAYIRGGSDADQIVGFLDRPLYKNLRDPFYPVELEEVKKLMAKIKVEMADALKLFGGNDFSRGLLVYHLIDIPLIKFPERIGSIIQFYEEKMEDFVLSSPLTIKHLAGENTQQMDELADKLRASVDGAKYLLGLRSIGENSNLNHEDRKKKLEILRSGVAEMRREYNKLLADKSSG
ncbi:MAG: hypothetical protein AAB965_00415, partial [Patescibacteria group bacterium]